MDFYFRGFFFKVCLFFWVFFRGIFAAYHYNIILCILHLNKNYTIFKRMNCYDLNINGTMGIHGYCAENYLFIYYIPILFTNKTSRSANLLLSFIIFSVDRPIILDNYLCQ